MNEPDPTASVSSVSLNTADVACVGVCKVEMNTGVGGGVVVIFVNSAFADPSPRLLPTELPNMVNTALAIIHNYKLHINVHV